MKKTVTVTTEITYCNSKCSVWCAYLANDVLWCTLFHEDIYYSSDGEEFTRCPACLEATGDKLSPSEGEE